jgi:hypothetical protein
MYKFEDIQLKYDKLQNNYLTEVEEKNRVKDEFKMLQLDMVSLRKDYDLTIE